MPPLIPDVVGDSDETEEVVVVVFGVVPELLMGALIGQHEHSPGKAGIEENKKFVELFVFMRCGCGESS